MKNSFLYFLSKYLNSYLPITVGVSKNTIKAYSDTFKLLFIFAKEKYKLKPKKIHLETLDKKFILEFANWVVKTRNCTDTTRNLRLSNIKAFFSYIQTQIPSLVLQAQSILEIPKKKVERKVVDYLMTEDIQLILDQANKNTIVGRKHLVILSFLYATAARVQELVDVTIGDFKYNNNNSIRLVGKGNKARLVPLQKEVIIMLEKYIEYEKKHRVFFNSTDPLFLNPSNKKLTRQGIAYIVKKYTLMAQQHNSKLIPFNVHAHTFRHSRAMALLEGGVELIYIRDFLGHYSVTTTEIYARANNVQIREALLKISPIQNINEIAIWEKDKELLEYLKNLSDE